MMKGKKVRMLAAAALLAVLAGAGCGRIVDKDRIRVAKMGDAYITRGDIFKLIREMPDTDRPKIRSRGDLLRVLNQHIDQRIKLPLGKKLKEEGKIDVDREQAREVYFQERGDEADYLRAMWQAEIPVNNEITPLMKVYDLTPDRLRNLKQNIEDGTDAVVARLLGESAVQYLAVEAFKEKRITISDEEFEREYRFSGETLDVFEEIAFRAVRFPASLPDASARASEVRARLDAGEPFDALVDEFLRRGAADNIEYVIESGIQNNPALDRFRGFWEVASGAAVDTIIGPVYLPAYRQVATDAQGRARALNMPDAYLVLRVLECKPARKLTLEEAKPALAAPLIVGKMMQLLRDENGVEIYQENLPDVGDTTMQGTQLL
ncbi:MAG TPA: hypothetical protein PKN23_01265 [Candidatus Hydrogenedentes bacterium]|nr:hypothetical protein [Candidatus Hydrogenedentota bacterium]